MNRRWKIKMFSHEFSLYNKKDHCKCWRRKKIECLIRNFPLWRRFQKTERVKKMRGKFSLNRKARFLRENLRKNFLFQNITRRIENVVIHNWCCLGSRAFIVSTYTEHIERKKVTFWFGFKVFVVKPKGKRKKHFI